jgi:hypothetical protein
MEAAKPLPDFCTKFAADFLGELSQAKDNPIRILEPWHFGAAWR